MFYTHVCEHRPPRRRVRRPIKKEKKSSVCALSAGNVAHPCARTAATPLCTFSCPVCTQATDICSFAPPFPRAPHLFCPGVLGFRPPLPTPIQSGSDLSRGGWLERNCDRINIWGYSISRYEVRQPIFPYFRPKTSRFRGCRGHTSMVRHVTIHVL